MFDEGKRLFKEGKYTEACKKFEASLDISKEHLATLVHLGRCYEQTGRLASAWSTLRRARGLATQADPQAVAKLNETIVALEGRLARVNLRTPPGAPNGLTVKLDNLDVTKSLNTPFAIDAGEHVLQVSAEAREDSRSTFSIKDGEQREVPVAIGAPRAQEPTTPKDPPVTSTDPETEATDDDSRVDAAVASSSSPWTPRRKIAVGVAGAGIVGLGIGLGLGAKALGEWNDAHSNGRCNDATVCDEAGFALVESAHDTARISTIVTSVGLVAIAAGAVLWVTGKPEGKTYRAVAPSAGPEHVGIHVFGSF